jgi:AcrR family transcriptional regulator
MLARVSRARSNVKSPALPQLRPGKEGGKRAENRRARVDALHRAALTLFLQHGIEAVTIDQIVDGAGTAKGSFYRYFKDKADIIVAIMSPVAEEVRASFARCAVVLQELDRGGDMTAPYRALAEDLIRIVITQPDVVRLYLHESRGPRTDARRPVADLADEILKGATMLSDLAREQGFLGEGAGRLSAIVVVGATELLMTRLFAGDDVGPVLEVPAKVTAIVLDGVRAEPRRKPR